jgi:hypothetical protein
MQNLNNMLTAHRRLGVYWSGDKPFFNKVDAFKEATSTGASVRWDFNDDIFSSIDWKIPIETSLPELYRQRAQQLRDKYDYVSLFFSGGVDSANVLHSFIDNNILLDEIVMFRPKSVSTNITDMSNANIYAEIEYAAIPHLKEHLKDARTVVRFIDIDDIAYKYLNNDKLLTQIEIANNIYPTSLIKSLMCMTDPVWNDLYKAGKNVCHIQGTDKPYIKITDGKAYFRFLDFATFIFEPMFETPETEMIRKHQFHELFYWTPDMPQLVIKQCQVVKRLYEIEAYKEALENADRVTQDRMAFVIQYIYPRHVNDIRNRFCVEKAGFTRNSGMHDWFFEKMPESVIGRYNYMASQMRTSLDYKFFVCVKSIYMDDPVLPEFDGFIRRSFKMSRSKLYEL